MGIDAKCLPENFLRRMSKEDRRPMAVAGMTIAEIDDKQRAQDERQLQDRIKSLLAQRDIVAGYSRMDRKTTYVVGWPDFVFPLLGRFVALEVKLPGEAPTAEQLPILLALIKQGAFVRVVHSERETVDALNQLIAEEEEGKKCKAPS
jgi:hypothetical protein